MSIDERLQIYGPSVCPICGDHREIIFGRVSGELVCRKHPGHPLFGQLAQTRQDRNAGRPIGAMLDLESIVARWKLHAEAAPIGKHPDVWVAHFGTSDEAIMDRILNGPRERTTSMLGSLAATDPNNYSHAVLFLASPYALCAEVKECAVVVDVNHILHVTHLAHEGRITRTTDYQIPYGIDDRGKITVGMADKRPSAVWGECGIIHEQRTHLQKSYPFQEAFGQALTLGERLL